MDIKSAEHMHIELHVANAELTHADINPLPSTD